MRTDIHTPAEIFNTQQRLLVPLFQRPYVWNEELQWDPLWRDLQRVLTRYIEKPSEAHQPHFLGAVVTQQVQNQIGEIQQRTIIDGQQRLTTLQIMFHAIYSQLVSVSAENPAARLKKLIENDEAYCNSNEDRFKVWPTNKDRAAFAEVFNTTAPTDYSSLQHTTSKMVLAHKFFSQQVNDWLKEEGEAETLSRAEAIDKCCRDLFQFVVIDLAATENAQEIFETLNARGAALTAADLVKNFIFQRLSEQNNDIELAYEKYWKKFETAFWEKEINYGRVKFQRASLFINHWLISKTGEEVLNREIFSRFKTYSDYESSESMMDILKELYLAAEVYEKIYRKADDKDATLSRLELFVYRLNSMELDVLRPLLIALIDPAEKKIDDNEINKSVTVIESWMIRRLLTKATNKNYNKIVVDLVNVVRKNRQKVAASLEKFFKDQNSITGYWPDDSEIFSYVSQMEIYRGLYKSRIRMILEAIEDYERGFIGEETSKSGARVRRGTYAIEHLMPQSWQKNWPLGEYSEDYRESIVQTLGNLTLLTTKLNSSVSNGAWEDKNLELTKHDILLSNKKIQQIGADFWNEDLIKKRTEIMVEKIMKIWPVPEGHKSIIIRDRSEQQVRVQVIDLISAGLVSPGQLIYAKPGQHTGHQAQILDDGRIEVNGIECDSLSLAGRQLLKRSNNGWTFWLVDEKTRKSMADLREEYRELIGLEEGESDIDDDTEE